MNEVEAQLVKKIADTNADLLLAAAQEIMLDLRLLTVR